MTNYKQNIDQIFDNIVGKNNNFSNASDKERYERGYRYGKGVALRVLRPQNSEQLSEILSFCNANRISVVPQGGNTGLVAGSCPDASGEQVVVSTQLLNLDVFKVNEDDKTVFVGAGCVLQDLNDKLSQYNLFFPIDIGAAGSCNIGGLISTNAAGVRAGCYGNVKARLVEYEVVLADGTIKIFSCCNESGQMQNNSRIDLHNPFVGSGGWLGIISKAKLHLEKVPKVTDSIVVVPKDGDSISKILEYLTKRFGKELTAFEGMSSQALMLVAKNIPNTQYLFSSDDVEYSLLIEVSSEDINYDVTNQLLEAFSDLLDSGLVTTGLQGKPEQYWHQRHHISESLAKEGKVIATDIAIPNIKDLSKFRKEATNKLNSQFDGLIIAPFGHEMLGAMHFNVVWPRDKKLEHKQKQKIQSIIYDKVVKEYKGTFSAEHGVGPHNYWAYNIYTSKNDKKIADKLKKQYDPNGILNPNIKYN